MLRKIRIALAAVFFVGITLLFVGIGQGWWGWMAKLQFLPACLGLNAAVIAALVVITLLFGRIYCSVICPLGIFQDQFYALHKRLDKKHRQTFSPEKKWLRYTVLAVFIACLIAGVQIIIALLAPYSAYGRIVSSIANPASWITVTVVAVTAITLAYLAWRGGRTYCNTFCPVGTFLSFFSRFSLFRPVIDTDKCVKCHQCERACRASCIDVDAGKIDYSRCVDCFDCLDSCKLRGLSYRPAVGGTVSPRRSSPLRGSPPFSGANVSEETQSLRQAHTAPEEQRSPSDASRRSFIAGAAAIGTALTLKAQENKLDGGFAAIEDKKRPERSGRIVPPGAESEKNFYSHCTACQLCVQNCPNKVLSPSTDLEHLMQPQMNYDRGWCRPECTACSQVCPAGAIKPLTTEEKTVVHIGTATLRLDLCFAATGKEVCGNCARHCPTGAIVMVAKNPKDRKSPRIPSIDEAKCIGCGACEYLCPARPFSAIYVNGLKEHRNG